MYLSSDDVHVFPFGTTRESDPIARIFNEQNVSQIIRNVTDVEGFVTSYDKDKHIMEFMLHGYYFKINLTKTLNNIGSGKSVTAYIVVDKQNKYEYLIGNDSTETKEFSGLYINEPPQISTGVYSLMLLDETGEVPLSSKSKFSSESLSGSLNIDRIVCGTSTKVID